jgi:hypothetical protein
MAGQIERAAHEHFVVSFRFQVSGLRLKQRVA